MTESSQKANDPILTFEGKRYALNMLPDELKELYDNLKKRGLEVIAAYRKDNQCGWCGVELTSSEIKQILESKFQQCS